MMKVFWEIRTESKVYFFSDVSKAGLKLIVLGFIPFLLQQLRI